jgi:hypothetical protein
MPELPRLFGALSYRTSRLWDKLFPAMNLTRHFRQCLLLIGSMLALVACASNEPRTGPLGETIYPRVPGGDHTKSIDERVTYDQSPPIGGKHAGIWQNCGVYDDEVRSEPVVHSLEHGAVWITYKPDVAEADKSALRLLVYQQPYRLLSMYPTQDAAIVLTAWGVQLKLQTYDEDKIKKFIERYGYQGTDSLAPEKGAQCVGGTGAPRQ